MVIETKTPRKISVYDTKNYLFGFGVGYELKEKNGSGMCATPKPYIIAVDASGKVVLFNQSKPLGRKAFPQSILSAKIKKLIRPD